MGHRRVVACILVLVPSLGGCADGIDGVSVGVIVLAAVLVALLAIAPPLQAWLDRREHRRRMLDRPWLKKDVKPGRRRREG